MSWHPDRPPIEYLERRIKYYKKKVSSVKSSVNNEWLIKKYTKRGLIKAVEKAIIHYVIYKVVSLRPSFSK